MQTVQRSGVEFDICPTCRGVWLDRGELEKLLALSGDGGESQSYGRASPPPYQAPPPERGRSWRDDDDDDYRRRKRKSSIFDIFD